MSWLAVAGWLAAGSLGVARVRLRAAIARAAHEVRGPLCAARLGLHGLDGVRAASVDLELCRAALALEDLGGRRRALRVDAVDLRALVRECTPAWRALAGRHGARLAVDAAPAPVCVSGDRLRLAQACANLVANAAEHGGGLVRVAVVAAAGRVRVEVRDDGPGLPAPVGTLVGRPRGRGGRRGHGLAVAAAVAEAHGGRLAAAPAHAGARLVLELPAAVARGDLPAAIARGDLPAAGARGDLPAAEARRELPPAAAQGDLRAAEARRELPPAAAEGDPQAAAGGDPPPARLRRPRRRRALAADPDGG
jgi:signal transduction histidine kinase